MPTAPDSPELAAVEDVPVAIGWLLPATRVAAVQAEGRRPVLASGCGAVSTFLAEPTTVEVRPPHGDPVSGTPQRHGAGAAGAQ